MHSIYEPPKAYKPGTIICISSLIKRAEDPLQFLTNGGTISLVTDRKHLETTNHQAVQFVRHLQTWVDHNYKSILMSLYMDEEEFLQYMDSNREEAFELEMSYGELLSTTKVTFVRNLGAVKYDSLYQQEKFKKHLIRFLTKRRERKRCTILTWAYPLRDIFDAPFIEELKALLDVNQRVI